MSISITSGKLVNSLYANNNGSTSYYTGTKVTTHAVINENVESSLNTKSSLRSAINKLSKCDYSTGLKSQIQRNAKKFVKEYNEILDSTATSSKKYNKLKNELKSLITDNESELSKVGLTYSDKKLKFDTTVFEEADMDDIEKVFSKNSSFMTNVSLKINSMERLEKDNLTSIVTEEKYYTGKLNSGNIALCDYSNRLSINVATMLSTPLKQDLSNYDDVITLLNDYANNMNKFYDELADNTDAKYTSKSIELANQIIEKNQTFIDEVNSGNIPYNERFDIDNPDSYGNQIKTLYQEFFREIAATASNGFEVTGFVDYSV